MQRNKSNEIARDIIRTAKETFNEKINNITLFNLTDEPYKMFSIKCTIYNYFVLVFNYDRGHFGCNIVCGDDAMRYQMIESGIMIVILLHFGKM